MARYKSIGDKEYKQVPTIISLQGMHLDRGVGSVLVQHGLKELDANRSETGLSAPAALAPQESQMDISDEDFVADLGGVPVTKEMVLGWFAQWYDARF